MADLEDKRYYCEKCNKTMRADKFYTSNNLEKYPNEGKMGKCKECMTMHVDNFNPDTFLWILQEIDVPYVPKEWNKLLAKFGKDKSKLTGMTILGRYLSAMKLKQYKDYRWKDNDFIQELQNAEIEQAMKRQGYDAQQIATAVKNNSWDIPTVDLREPAPPVVQAPVEDFTLDFSDEAVDIVNDDLTDEDRTYLRLKWGKAYKPEEWVRLEQLYEEMINSYDIQSAGHIDTLKLVCKTSLKANQLLDIGDVDGAQKMVKMYDSLMKSGKFTAAQNKAESGEYVDSVSELVALCEKDGFIPRYYTDGPQDKVDKTLLDLQSYTKTLVTEEMNLGNLIENAVKQIELDKEKEAMESDEDADDLDDLLFDEDSKALLADEDFSSFKEFEENLEEADDEFLKDLIDEGELD